jgi:hypothetical protein
MFDMGFCFLQEYQDEETYTMVNNLRKIAIHYIKSSFIFDFIAIIPFEFFLNDRYGLDKDSKNDKFRILKLFRLLRLARLGELLKIERFK